MFGIGLPEILIVILVIAALVWFIRSRR